MSMSEIEHSIEGRLLVQVRKAIASFDRLLTGEFVKHYMTLEEIRGRRDDLVESLINYEDMMIKREGGDR